MKIAILSTPWIAVPPTGYGGIELVVANLCKGLTALGHDVTLFATGDSITSAKLRYIHDHALGNDFTIKRKKPYLLLEHIHGFFDMVRSEHFDILHNNCQYMPMFFFDLQNKPFLHTLHGGYYKNLMTPTGSNKEIRELLHKFEHHPFVSISNNQRTDMPHLNYIKTIYNAINIHDFNIGTGSGGYLAWMGRITPNKGVDTAIDIALQTGIPLKIAAFIDPTDKQYYEAVIKPKLANGVELVGEIRTTAEKSSFLGDAIATLIPIRWHEPFGLVMVESLACGTPVIAFRKGSAPEIIAHGKTGFIADTQEQMIHLISNIHTLSRSDCRNEVQERFSIEHMANEYIQSYNYVLSTYER